MDLYEGDPRANGLPVGALVLFGKPGAPNIAESSWFKRVWAWAQEPGITA